MEIFLKLSLIFYIKNKLTICLENASNLAREFVYDIKNLRIKLNAFSRHNIFFIFPSKAKVMRF